LSDRTQDSMRAGFAGRRRTGNQLDVRTTFFDTVPIMGG
jgi:hypothetical protein